MNYYLLALKKYAVFEGRASRAEFWYYFLFNIIIGIILQIINKLIGNQYISSLYSLAVLLPGLAVTVRRLHDVGKSAWTILIIFIPVVGGILFLVYLASKGKKGENKYGTDLKEAMPAVN